MVVSPLTGSSEVEIIKIIETKQLLNDWKHSFNIDIAEELQSYSKIYLYQCNQTKLKFFLPLDIVGSGKLYEQLQNFEWYYMPNKWEYQVALRDLQDCKNVLEIGCAFGNFVNLGLDAGLDIRGIELNKAAVAFAKKSDLPVECLDLEDAACTYYESMDAVCSFQVLEHVPNPKDFINWSLQMLKPGGKLVYCVPNSESFLKYQYNLLDLPPHHMLQWSEATFNAIEKIFPIKLEKVVFEPLAQYHVSGYLNSYSNYFYSVSPLAKVFFNRYTLPLYQTCLNLGLRKILTGQSLYVQFSKVE